MFEKLQNIISDTLSIDKDLILRDTTLEDLKIDSLDFYEIAMQIEDKLGIGLDGYELENIKKIDDIVHLLEKKSK